MRADEHTSKRFIQIDVLEKEPGQGDLPVPAKLYGYALDMACVAGFGASIINPNCTRVHLYVGVRLEVDMDPDVFKQLFQDFTGHKVWNVKYEIAEEG